jgi:DEAD/DEAH box helicase domain-containing protein
MRVGNLDVWSMDQAQLLTVNDNAGRLYQMDRHADGSYVANDPSGDEGGVRGAIGEVRVTDALLILPAGIQLEGAAVATLPSSCPSGRAAIHSFAEALRRGCQAELDIDPSEITVGLQGRIVGDTVTSNIYVADTLENGAGYATELARPERLLRVITAIVDSLGKQWNSPVHSECDASCPDCLRSYDNRHLHPLLDWRLALDLAEMSLARGLTIDRWLGQAEHQAMQFRDTYLEALDGDCDIVSAGDLVALKSGNRAVVLGHPLWRREESHWNERQALAVQAMQSMCSSISVSDVRQATRFPESLFGCLTGV